MLYAIFSLDKPGAAALRDATRAAHLAYLERHRDKVVLGKPQVIRIEKN